MRLQGREFPGGPVVRTPGFPFREYVQKSSVPGPSAFAETLSATLPPRDSKFSSARERLGEAVRAWNPGHKMHKSGELRYSVGIIANDTISCT